MIAEIKIGTIAMTPLIVGIILLLKNKFQVSEKYLWIVQGVLSIIAFGVGEMLPDIYLGQAETYIKMLALFLAAAGTLTISSSNAYATGISVSGIPLVNYVESDGLTTKLSMLAVPPDLPKPWHKVSLMVLVTLALTTLVIGLVALVGGYSLGAWGIPMGILLTFLSVNGWWAFWTIVRRQDLPDIKS